MIFKKKCCRKLKNSGCVFNIAIKTQEKLQKVTINIIRIKTDFIDFLRDLENTCSKKFWINNITE